MALFEPLFEALHRRDVRYVKRLAGRAQDRADIEALEEIARRRGRQDG